MRHGSISYIDWDGFLHIGSNRGMSVGDDDVVLYLVVGIIVFLCTLRCVR